MHSIQPFERVILTVDLPEVNLKQGDIGTVVDVYEHGQGYEVEFITLQGRTVAVETLLAAQVRPASERDVPHVRELEAA
jgi:ATP-dependent exoDNAse (exonuclease V) alpha subunit